MQNPMISSRLRGRPSSSVPLRIPRRSFPSVTGESMCSIRNSAMGRRSAAAGPSARSGAAMTASDQRRKSARSASPTPNSSAITAMGTAEASASTASTGSSGGTASRAWVTVLRMASSRGATARGVNRRFTTFRYTAWTGGSRWRIEKALSPPEPSERIGSLIRTPRPDTKRSGSRLTVRMSSWRVTAQPPSAVRTTGARARRSARMSK